MSGASDVGGFVERMRSQVDETIEGLKKTHFREDPIGGRKYSRATSIISSAYKRQGQLLVNALVQRLRDCSRFNVWQEDKFKLSFKSDEQLHIHSLHVGKCLSIKLPYGDCERTIPIDAVVYDKDTETLRTYNVKRGNGSYDAGKVRLIKNELLRTNMLLGSYGEHERVRVSKAEAKIVFYYGLRSIGDPLSLIGTDLDLHFGFPVFAAIEAMNEYFKSKLYRLIENE